jgi:hypothetical protein
MCIRSEARKENQQKSCFLREIFSFGLLFALLCSLGCKGKIIQIELHYLCG